MQGTGTRRTALAAITAASILATISAAPAAATTGWLDPTFSDNGWVRLPAHQSGRVAAVLVITAGPSGRTVVGREVNLDETADGQAIVLTPGGAPSPTFNGGSWRSFIQNSDSFPLTGFFATSPGGVIGAQGPNFHREYRIVETDAAGAVVRSLTHNLGSEGITNANLVRLPGGSLRTCYHDAAAVETRLLGFTPALQLDTAVGPNGHRAIPASCSHVGSDTAGHLYFGISAGESADGTLDLLRTTTSGVVDTGWSGDGHATVAHPALGIDFPDESVSAGPDFATASSPIVALPDGSLLIAARVTRDALARNWSAAVIKLTPDGALDPTFDGDGIRAFGPASGTSWALAMAADAAGRPVMSVVYDTATDRKAYLARFTDDGRFDAAFGRGGLIQQTFGAASIAIDGQGRILTAARDGAAVIVARRNG